MARFPFAGKQPQNRLICAAALAVVGLVTACEPSSISGYNPQARVEQSKDKALRTNMRTVQVAAEHFASDHKGVSYPVAIDAAFKSYLPGGSEGSTPSPIGPVNPFTGMNEFPVLGTVQDIAAVRAGPRSPMRAGSIEYNSLANGRGYAIVGGAHDGRMLMDIYNPGQVLVLTNVRD